MDKSRLFAPVSVPCFDWKGSDGDEPMRRTAIIAPVRITECEDGSVQVSWACSRGALCRDKACRYSHATQTKAEDM